MEEEARAIENAVDKTLEQKYRTADIISSGDKIAGTTEMGKEIVKNI
jgi:3-isopropylmalate dehydrogenase